MAFSKRELVTSKEKKIVAVSARTSFSNESGDDAQISKIVSSYFARGLQDKILHKQNPGVMIDGFMSYEAEHQHGCFYDGSYDYFIGEEVSDFGAINYEDLGLKQIEIPAGNYIKLTTIRGLMPNIIIDAWHKIWKMTEGELGGKRAYLVDFQVFDERSRDPSDAEIDIYIGVE
jgi:predicted transcriptional regulator YdeE